MLGVDVPVIGVDVSILLFEFLSSKYDCALQLLERERHPDGGCLLRQQSALLHLVKAKINFFLSSGFKVVLVFVC